MAKTLFGMPIVIDPNMPADQAALVSTKWDDRLGKMVELDRVRVINLGLPK